MIPIDITGEINVKNIKIGIRLALLIISPVIESADCPHRPRRSLQAF